MSGTGNISRRHLLQGGAVLGLSIGMPVAAWAGRPHVAGFEPEPWFIESCGGLATDAAEAGADGKYLALLWEQRGCHYCEELHRVNFRDADVIALGKKHFRTIQMDLWGKREFLDSDGEKRTEAAIARGRFVRSTPVMLFVDAKGTEVFRMPCYAPPALNLAVYLYVAEGGFKTASLREWVKKNYPSN